jgi:hypothetical protein
MALWQLASDLEPKIDLQRKLAAPYTHTALPSFQSIPQLDFLYIRDPKLADYQFSADNSKVTMVPSKTTLSTETGTASFTGKRQRSLTCSASVSLHLDQELGHVHAGLALYKEDIRHAEIFYDFSSCTINFKRELKLKGPAVTQSQSVTSTPDAIGFRIRAEPSQYTFEFRTGENGKWVEVGAMDTAEITGYDFSGPILGVFACTEDLKGRTPVVFSGLEII